MKKTLIRIIALLMALSCAITLFGCQEEEDSIRRKKSKKKETTEEVMDYNETVGLEEETEQAWGEKVPEQSLDEKVDRAEATTAPPVVERLPDPGTIQMPISVLFDYNYDTLCSLNWFTLKTEPTLDGRWVLTTEMNGATFTFVFNDLNATAYVVTVDDNDGSSNLYITYDMQFGDTADELPSEVYEELGPMDGGVCAPCIINGHDADILLHGDMENVDSAVVYLVQLRRRN